MRKQRLVFWLAACFFLLMLAVMAYQQDLFRYIYTGQDLAGVTERYVNDSRYADADSNDAGLFAYTDRPIEMKPGRYRLYVLYDVSEAGSSVALVSDKAVGADNTPGQTLAAAPLAPGQNELFLDFELEYTLRDARIEVSYGGAGTFILHNASLTSGGLYYTDHLYLALLVLALALFLDWRLFRRPLQPGQSLGGRMRAFAPAFCIVALALLASYPLITPYLNYGHDLAHHLARLEGVAEELRTGQFPVRILGIFPSGKGYAEGLFYPNLFLLPSALLRLAGVSLVGSYKALCLAINIATAALSYTAGRRIFKSGAAAAVLCILYTLAPYRIENLYLRAALGEVQAMVFLPLVLWGLYEIFAGDAKKWPIAVVGFTGIIQSHMLSLMMTGFICLGVFIVMLPRLVKQAARLLQLAKAAGLTLLLNLTYLLPFAYMGTQGLVVNHTQHLPQEHAAYPAQLFMTFANPAGVSDITESMADDMLMGPGIPLLFAAFGLLALLLFCWPRQRPALGRLGGVCIALATLCLWACTTAFPWAQVIRISFVGKMLATVQFPWRFLSLATLFLALCGGILAALYLRPAWRWPALIALVLVCLVQPAWQMDGRLNTAPYIDKEYHILNFDTALPMGSHFYYPGTNSEALIQMPNTLQPLQDIDGFTVQNLQQRGTSLSFSYTAGEDGQLQLPRIWYPGYTVTNGDGQLVENTQGENKLMVIHLAAGEGSITLRYTGLWFFRVGDVASLLTLLGVIAWPIVLKQRKKKHIPPVAPLPQN